jgi:hypothetical protein
MSRYSDIRRGAELNRSLTNYINHLSNPPERNVGGGTARDANKPVYVVPFGTDIATDEVVEVAATQAHWAALSTYINQVGTGAEVLEAPGANTVVTVGRIIPARIVWFRNATKTKTVARSAVTNNQYLKYAGDRNSLAFGRENPDDDMYDAYQAIRATIRAATAQLAVNRISLTPERIYQA